MLVGQEIPFREIAYLERQSFQSPFHQELGAKDLELRRKLSFFFVELTYIQDLLRAVLFPKLNEYGGLISGWGITEVEVRTDPR